MRRKIIWKLCSSLVQKSESLLHSPGLWVPACLPACQRALCAYGLLPSSSSCRHKNPVLYSKDSVTSFKNFIFEIWIADDKYFQLSIWIVSENYQKIIRRLAVDINNYLVVSFIWYIYIQFPLWFSLVWILQGLL